MKSYKKIVSMILTIALITSFFTETGNVFKLGVTTARADDHDIIPPTTPANVTCINSTETEISLSWAASSDNMDVAEYDIYRDNVYIGNTVNTIYTDIERTASTIYTYTVIARDAAENSSDASMPVSFATANPVNVTAPTDPSDVTNTSLTETSIDLTWLASTDDTEISYIIIRDGVVINTTSNTSYSDTGLSSSTIYTYTIRAIDADGYISGASKPTSFTTLNPNNVIVPSEPTEITGSSETETSIGLSWTASTDGTGIADYYIFRDGALIGSTDITTYTDSNLSPSTIFTYTIKSVNNDGYISETSIAQSYVTDNPENTTFPSVPSNLVCSSRTDSSLSINWTASTDDVGILEYAVFRNGALIGYTPDLGYTDIGLSEATTYNYTVLAIDTTGFVSDISSQESFTTADITPPSVPTDVTTTSVKDTTVILEWIASTDNAGVTGYIIYRDGTEIGNTTDTTYTDSGLSANASYTYTITSQDAAGNISNASAALTVTTTVSFAYIINPDNTLTITGYTGNQTEVIIPSIISGQTVTGISASAFAWNTAYTSIVVPDSVTNIGDRAFAGCSNLTNITIPNSVTSIGEYALSNTSITTIVLPENLTEIDVGLLAWSELESITIPDGVTSIGVNAFQRCKFSSITIPSSVTSIGGYAFAYCESLEDITISNGVTNIDTHAFTGCTDLTSIQIPDSVTSIGDYAFASSSLTDVELSENLEEIDAGLFAWTPLSSITIPDSVTCIGVYAFTSCPVINITIPNSVTSIGDYAFYSCEGLVNVTMTDSVTSIGDHTFEGCDNLTITIIDITSPSAPSNVTATSVGDTTVTLEWTASTDNVGVTEYIIYRDGTEIGNTTDTTYTDSGLSADTTYTYTITAQDAAGNTSDISAAVTVTTIVPFTYNINPDNTLTITGYTGTGLDVVIPETIAGQTVTAIGDSAFEDCSTLTSIVMPNGVTTIGDTAFMGCSSLTSITIPNGVSSIGEYAFYQCSSLADVTIPDSVTSIGAYAFYYCGLEDMSLPDGLMSIEDSTFGCCSNLASVIIPDSVTSIGSSAFSSCTSLASITIPDSVTTIETCAFMDSGLTSITIPEGVTSIELGTFYGCWSLADVTIPDSVTGIGNMAFRSCGLLTEITMPDGLTTIGVSAFRYCSELTNIVIPNSVTSIGDYAFYYCSGLASILIPESTTYGEHTFDGCDNLTITIIDTTSPSAPSNVTVNVSMDLSRKVQSANTRMNFLEPAWSVAEQRFQKISPR